MSLVLTHGANAPEALPPSSLEVYQDPKYDPSSNSSAIRSSQYKLLSHGQDNSTDRSRRSKILGLGPFAAGLLLGCLIALVLAAAVGGGLGATLASCRSKSTLSQAAVQATATVTVAGQIASTASVPSSTASQTATVIDYSPLPILQIYNLSNPCPDYVERGINPRTNFGTSFAPQCGRDYNTRGQGTRGGVVSDLAALVAYTFEDCMQACSGYNRKSQIWNRPETCRAISWDMNIATSYNANNANCWLKNDTCKSSSTCGVNNPNVMGAVLLT